MTTPKDREQLHQLNGIAAPHPRNPPHKASLGPWKNSPTPISPSTNPPRMVHQSGTNPYGDNPNKKNIGNQTSTRVLMPSGPPPRKKVKTEHTPHAASSGSYARQGHGTNPRSKRSHQVLLSPETIDVDDWGSEMHDDNNHTNIISSPDELNICSPSTEEAHSSKYRFNTSKHGSTVRNNKPPIAPDGESTEWAMKEFSQDSSDHISNRNLAPSGQVKETVAMYERKGDGGPIPKIDLRDKIGAKMKNRGGNKDHNLTLRQQPSREQMSQAVTKNNVLPLKELYLDDEHHTGGVLEIYWTKDGMISIKSDKRTIFGLFDIRSNCHSLTYHDGSDLPINHDPIFQLKTIPRRGRHGTNVECLTVKLDGSSLNERNKYYSGLLIWLRDRVNEKEFIRASAREKLWEGVAFARAETKVLTKHGDSGKSSRLDKLREGEPRRTKRSLIDDQSKPPAPPKCSASQRPSRITPLSPSPPITVSVSDNQKHKQRSRQDANDFSDPVIPRRSTRSTSGVTRSPAIDNDEVILVYPSGVPGAVNITNGDLLRLQPYEFLNDTLIEFGLKLWLKELEQTDPILASQVHVFNSFFYKKLNQKKGTNLGGYESVRKWTSKFDIFQKKYIIVPINEHLHWYLAIICEPEHVLVPAASNMPSTRQQTRQSVSEPITKEPIEIPTAPKSAFTSISENDKDEDIRGTPSEAEVEHTLHDFEGSCSISNIGPGENESGVDGGRSPSVLSYVSDDIPKHVPRPLSPMVPGHERAPPKQPPSDEKMAMDLADDPPVRHIYHNEDPVPETRSVDATSFYQRASPKKDKAKRTADPEPDSFAMEIDDDDGDDGGSVLSDVPKTYIFIFDSLGGRHPQAINRLSTYLKMEAQDKKNVVHAGTATGKAAMVPVQDNFCDCGIYLLHLAQTFMSDPAYYRHMILAQKSKTIPLPERQVTWHAHQIQAKREDLTARIVHLSDKWKKERAAKEEAKQKEALTSRTLEVVESSDCEIDILEPTPSTSKAKAGKKTAGRAANRLRG